VPPAALKLLSVRLGEQQGLERRYPGRQDALALRPQPPRELHASEAPLPQREPPKQGGVSSDSCRSKGSDPTICE
jgi:hypothetical protein